MDNGNNEVNYVDIDNLTKVSGEYKVKVLSAIINFVNNSHSYVGFTTKFDRSNTNSLKFSVDFHYNPSYKDTLKHVCDHALGSKMPNFELKVANTSYLKDFKYRMISWDYLLVLKPKDTKDQYVVRYHVFYNDDIDSDNNDNKELLYQNRLLNNNTWKLYNTCRHINENNNLDKVNTMVNVLNKIMEAESENG